MPRITPEDKKRAAKKDKMIDIERDAKIDYTAMSEECLVQIGPQFEGEPVRKGEYQVELGGPKANGVYMLRAKNMDEIEDGKITIVGPDIQDMEEGSSQPFALLVEIAGEGMDKETEVVPERRLHSYQNYLEGVWATGARTDSWTRIHKEAYEKGLKSFEELGNIFRSLYMSDFLQIKKVACTFITDDKKVEDFIVEAKEVFAQRDARMKDMSEEDVDEFYSCTLCSSFAPSHVCIISPDRTSLCGALNYLDAKMTFQMEPDGYVGKHNKGELIDPDTYEYEGINEAVKEKSMGATERVYLHSAFDFPHTSCGCFQGLLFYIPEVDGFGYVHRDFQGEIPNGRTFSSMAGEAAGGKQVEGLMGSAIEYLRSQKFLAGDGGLNRIVWLPKEIKEDLKDDIPGELYNKIGSEEEATNVEDLMEFLEKVGHPWLTQ